MRRKIRLSNTTQNLAEKHPEISSEWDYEKNDVLKPENFTVNSNRKVWRKCDRCGRSYLASIRYRIAGARCPYDSGKIGLIKHFLIPINKPICNT